MIRCISTTEIATILKSAPRKGAFFLGKNRYINTRFWSDSWIVDDLNPLDRYVLLYLLTNEKTNISGVYELPLRTIANETGLDKEEVPRMIKRLEPKVYYKHGWVVLVNAIKHQNYRNAKISAGIQRELCQARSELLELLHFPSDFDAEFSCPIDKSSMTNEDASHLIELNLIKSNSIKSNSTRPPAAGNLKIDKELAAKEKAARTRKPSKLTTKSVAEIFAGEK